MGAFFVGDIGVEVTLDCKRDISDATNVAIKVRKPNGHEVSWPAAFVPGTTTIRYVTQDGDLDKAGSYRLQAYMTLGEWTGRGEVAVLKVREIFE